MARGKPLISLSMKAYTVCTVSLFFGCIILTTIIYWAEGGSKVLPVISNIWTTPPSSYISRWMIGNGSDMYAFMTLALYFIEKAIGGNIVYPKFILVLALTGVFLLSVAGAICDNDKPTCLGNSAIHDFCTVGFFVLYDLSILLTYYNRRKRAGKSRWGFAMIMCLQSFALTLVTIILRLLLVNENEAVGSTLMAVVGYTNWSIVLVLTIHCIFTAHGVSNYGLGFLHTSGNSASDVSDTGVSVVWSVSAYEISLVCASLYLGTLAISCVAGLIVGYLPKIKGVFWFISDMWVNIPGNWFSRWGGIQGSHFGYLMQLSLFFVTRNKGRQIGLIISEIALFGLSIVCVCSEKEDDTIHVAAAFTYFIGYDIFILLTVFDNICCRGKPQDLCERKWMWLSHVFGTVVVGSHIYRLSFGGKIALSLKAAVEWTNALVIIGFAVFDVRAHSDCACYVVGIFHHPFEKKSQDNPISMQETVEFTDVKNHDLPMTTL